MIHKKMVLLAPLLKIGTFVLKLKTIACFQEFDNIQVSQKGSLQLRL